MMQKIDGISEKMKKILDEFHTHPTNPSPELLDFLNFRKKRNEERENAAKAAKNVAENIAQLPGVVVSTPATMSAYAKAEAYHATHGPASEADTAARLAICMACEHRAVTYKEVTDENGVGFCTKCGCGSNPRALLTVKLTMAGVECPLKKFGKVEGVGGSVASVIDSAKGVAQSIIHKLSGG